MKLHKRTVWLQTLFLWGLCLPSDPEATGGSERSSHRLQSPEAASHPSWPFPGQQVQPSLENGPQAGPKGPASGPINKGSVGGGGGSWGQRVNYRGTGACILRSKPSTSAKRTKNFTFQQSRKLRSRERDLEGHPAGWCRSQDAAQAPGPSTGPSAGRLGS